VSGLRILHLEDSPLDAELIREELAGSGLDPQIEQVTSGPAYLASLARGAFDLILADYHLPAFDGFEALEAARQVHPTVPFLFVSGAMGEENAIEALKHGATDYILKDRLGRLVPSIRRALAEARDRADLRQAAEALRRQEDRLRLAVEAADLGTWDYNPISGHITWSSRCNTIFNLPPDAQVDYDGFLQRLHPHDREQTDEAVQHALDPTGSGEYETEYRSVWDDGSEHWIVAKGRAFFEGEGPARRAVRFTGTVLDVTGRHRAEQDLRESEARFRQLADAMPQIVWTAQPDGRLDYFNRRWYEFTGLPSDADGDANWTRVIHPDDLQHCRDSWNTAIRSGELYQVEHRCRDHQGVHRWHLSRALAARDTQGQVIKWFGTATDIDDQKRAAHELAKAKEAAEAANRARDQFLAMLSHELRTPLTPILLDVTAILDDPLPPGDLRPTLEMIRQNIQLEARLIDDLLDVMSILRGKMTHSPAVVNVHELIRQAVGICRAEIHASRLALRIELKAETHHAFVDPARVQQVFWNLIKNAVKFTSSTGSVTIRSFNPALDRLVVEVEDNGVGIDPEVLPRIFQPFEQGEKTSTRRFGGLGLGLAISKSIVDHHAGKLTARSPGRNQGAIFALELSTVPSPPAHVKHPSRRGIPEPSGHKILLVEDDPATQQIMAKLLRRSGHSVIVAGSMAEGLDAAGTNSFDVIISDIGLPDGTGLDLLTNLRTRIDTPAIALTGYGMAADVQQSQDAGFNEHVTKPIDYSKLEALIQRLANGRPNAGGT
jgi:PAS domain S-box-containing protein